MICDEIHKILENEKEHKYKIYKATEKSPAAVEIKLMDMPVFLKDNTYILKDIETIIKEYYDFSNVFINIEDVKNNELIGLNIYMIL